MASQPYKARRLLQATWSACAIYLVAVAVCIWLASDFDGSIRLGWTGLLILLTLPWSCVSIFFAWALTHGAGLEFFAIIYMLFAAANVAVLNWFLHWTRLISWK